MQNIPYNSFYHIKIQYTVRYIRYNFWAAIFNLSRFSILYKNKLQFCLLTILNHRYPESIEWFIKDQAFSPSYNLAPPSSRQKVVSYFRYSCELTYGTGGMGWGRSQIIRGRENLVLYKSFNTLNRDPIRKQSAFRPFSLFLYPLGWPTVREAAWAGARAHSVQPTGADGGRALHPGVRGGLPGAGGRAGGLPGGRPLGPAPPQAGLRPAHCHAHRRLQCGGGVGIIGIGIIFENMDSKMMLKRSVWWCVSHENFRAILNCTDSSLLFAVNAKCQRRWRSCKSLLFVIRNN